MMRIKECTWHDVMDGIVESLYCTIETNIILYTNYIGIKIKLKKKIQIFLMHAQTAEESYKVLVKIV